MSFWISAASFLVAVGLLVSFHEFGHYWVAKRLNVKVLRFSLGFGRPLWKKIAGLDRTEYVIAAIPLGGYVKMLDEREGPVLEAEVSRAFNRQSVGKRMAIVAAGPLFNFLLAIVAYWLTFMLGVTGLKPIVGTVEADSPADKADLRRGDEIVQIGAERVPTWQTASLELLQQALADGMVNLRINRDGEALSTQIDLSDTAHLLSEGDLFEKLGMTPAHPADKPILGELLADGAALSAGLREGDRLLTMDGEPVETWAQWAEYVRKHPAKPIQTVIERQGEEVEILVVPEAIDEGDKRFGRIGAYPQVNEEESAKFFTTVRYNPLAGLQGALKETWKITVLTLKVLGRLLIGEASVRNISGPITIAQFAGASAAAGLSAFLGVLALFSISIGVLNLLPVPVLDGGHLLFYLVELIKGSPVSEFVQAAGQRIGLAVLAGLITLALYNDITRLMG
jgi:regulator of sigma E protease